MPMPSSWVNTQHSSRPTGFTLLFIHKSDLLASTAVARSRFRPITLRVRRQGWIQGLGLGVKHFQFPFLSILLLPLLPYLLLPLTFPALFP